MKSLTTAMEVYEALRTDKKVIWKTNSGDYIITIGDPIDTLLSSHIGGNATVWSFYLED